MQLGGEQRPLRRLLRAPVAAAQLAQLLCRAQQLALVAPRQPLCHQALRRLHEPLLVSRGGGLIGDRGGRLRRLGEPA